MVLHVQGMYIQMVGRGLRSYKGKSDCVVLDQSGNTIVHGPITGPAGYVPEPWGDDDSDAVGASRAKHKLVPLVRVFLLIAFPVSPCLFCCGIAVETTSVRWRLWGHAAF
jgi:hypothetical protein